MKFRRNKWDSSLLYAVFNLFSFTLQYAIYRVVVFAWNFMLIFMQSAKKSCCRHFGLVSHNNSLNFHSWCTRTLLLSSSRVCVVAQKSASRQFTLIMNYWKCHNSLLQPEKKTKSCNSANDMCNSALLFLCLPLFYCCVCMRCTQRRARCDVLLCLQVCKTIQFV